MPWNVPDDEKINYGKRIGKVIAHADRWGIPTMLEPVFLNTPRSPEIIAAEMEVARVCYDLGADIIKITSPGSDATAKLCDEPDIPIVAAGGRLSGDAASTVNDIRLAVEAARKAWSSAARSGSVPRPRPPT